MDAVLLERLVCPLCDSRPPLVLQGKIVDTEIVDREAQGVSTIYPSTIYLVCTQCGHGFPIVDDIPHLLPESAIDPEELKGLLNAR